MNGSDYSLLLSAFYKSWIFFRYIFIVLVVAFTLGGLMDFANDIYYWARQFYRRVFKKKLIKPLTLNQLLSVEEKKIALIIPAWQEADVIKNMLLNTINTIDYKNYFIFVGVYPNDPETQREIDQVREIYPQVIKVVNSRPGPTTKADCLNEIYRGLCQFEREMGLKFQIIVLSDSEDVHHPLSFKLFNYLMPRFEMIQIPIIPLEMPWNNFVGGVYMDEFAEMHLKELLVREKMARVLPSAGTSTAFWRESLSRLENENTGEIFNPKSLTEDYEIGIKLGKMGLRQIILIQYVERVTNKKGFFSRKSKLKRVKELVATRALFPRKFRQAMRQRARWIYGIAWQGLRNIGWDRNLKVSYSLFRDRLAFFTNLLYMFGYLLLFYLVIIKVTRLIHPEFNVLPIVRPEEIWWKLALVVMFFFFWRILMRFIFVNKLYGFIQAALAPIRIIVGNILNFASSALAGFWLLRSLITRQEQPWVKTKHEFPVEELASFQRKIGDLLLFKKIITARQLEEALEIQRRTRKKLGEILVELGYLSEEQLASALAYQKNWQFVKIDPYAVDPQLLKIIPKSLAESYRVFPLKLEGGTLHLAIDRVELGSLPATLENILKVKIKFSLTTSYDINYAIEKAYSDEFTEVIEERRMAGLLLKDGLTTQSDLDIALQRQKGTGKNSAQSWSAKR